MLGYMITTIAELLVQVALQKCTRYRTGTTATVVLYLVRYIHLSDDYDSSSDRCPFRLLPLRSTQPPGAG